MLLVECDSDCNNNNNDDSDDDDDEKDDEDDESGDSDCGNNAATDGRLKCLGKRDGSMCLGKGEHLRSRFCCRMPVAASSESNEGGGVRLLLFLLL